MVDFGNTLKTLRINNNLTQSQLAGQLGLTKSVISAYETGLRMPSYDENRREIDLSGLSEEEVAALLNLIKAMKR